MQFVRIWLTLQRVRVKRYTGRMCWSNLILLLVAEASLGVSQSSQPVTFEVASVKLNNRQVGPDYNNQVAFSPTGITSKNVTLRRLVAEAYRVQLSQVFGPEWIDQNEYEVSARAAHTVARAEMDSMLQSVLEQRFELKHHLETREMRIHKLVLDKGGPKIKASQAGEARDGFNGLRFHGEMVQFAEFLMVQFSIPATNDPATPVIGGGPTIPVLDKTGLEGTYDIDIDLKPELGTDMFTLWKRALPERLGLKLETGKDHVKIVVIDRALKVPTTN